MQTCIASAVLRRSFKHAATIVLLLLVLSLLSGCVDLFPVDKPASIVHLIPRINAPYHTHRSIQVCDDDTSSVPQQFFIGILAIVSDNINHAVQPNQDGATIYTTPITHDTYSSDQTLAPIIIPAIPIDPYPPNKKQISESGSVYGNTDAEAQAAHEYEVAVTTYNDTITQNHHLLARIQAEVKKQTDILRHFDLAPDSTGTEIAGCLILASERFRNVTGETYLIIQSDLQENITTQDSARISLKHTHVIVVDHFCAGLATDCQANDTAWQKRLIAAGAADVRFYDPAQTQTIQDNLFCSQGERQC